MLRHSGEDPAVADVKYKEPDPGEAVQQDLYQLLAYCVALGLPTGLLIYVGERPPRTYAVRRAGVDLEVLGVRVIGKSRDLEARVREVARQFVGQAADQYSRRGRPAAS